MDQNRQIRFLIPPFFLIASMLWGVHLDPCFDLSKQLSELSLQLSLAVIAGTTLTIVPLGFLISVISISFIRLIFLKTGRKYDALYEEDTVRRIWPILKSKLDPHRDYTLYAVATFDHEIVDKGIHGWVMRRWSAFHVSVHSAVAIGLSHLFALFLPIKQTRIWILSSIIFVILLVINAVIAYRETKGMLEFQSHRYRPKPSKK